MRALKFLVAGLLAFFTATAGAAARKPPRSIGAPREVSQFWELTLRYDRGSVVVLELRRRQAARGKTVSIGGEAGPLQVLLLDQKGRVLEAHRFSLPLVGPGEDDWKLGAGLTTLVRLRLPHVPGLRTLRIVDAGGKVLASHAARWPGDDAVGAPEPAMSAAPVVRDLFPDAKPPPPAGAGTAVESVKAVKSVKTVESAKVIESTKSVESIQVSESRDSQTAVDSSKPPAGPAGDGSGPASGSSLSPGSASPPIP